MVEAFGVEQGLEISGFSANPNNRPITRPQGIDPNVIARAGKDIIEGISDAAEAEEEANIVRSIANARDKMRRMEVGGKTPVEISTFRDEATSEILKRFPSAAAVNLVQTGLRASRAQKLEVRADGTVVSVDQNGNPISTVDPTDAGVALQASLMNKAVSMEADLPNYTELGSTIVNKALENGVDATGLVIGNTAVISQAVGNLHEQQGTLQLQISRVGFEQGKVARTRARNSVVGGAVTGLLELADEEMLNVLANTSSTITPGEVVQLANAYVADWVKLMNEEGSFGLLDINPIDFRSNMQGIVTEIGKTAQAAFSKNNTLLERRKVETDLIREINTNELFNNIAREQPNIFRLLNTAEGISNAADVLLQVREIEAIYPTARPATQELALDVLTALIGRTPAMEAAAVQGKRMKFSDVGSVESFVQWANLQMSDPSPAALHALKTNLNNRNDFATAERIMDDADRGDEWRQWFRQYNGYIKRLEANEQDTGITTEKALEGTRELRNETTKGAVETFFDELLEFEERQSDEITDEQLLEAE